jgi:hypothetical protein
VPLLQPHERAPRRPHAALLRLGLDFALFASVLLAWPVLRLGRVVLRRARSR